MNMDGWKTFSGFPFGALYGLFSGVFAVSFREGKDSTPKTLDLLVFRCLEKVVQTYSPNGGDKAQDDSQQASSFSQQANDSTNDSSSLCFASILETSMPKT